MRQSGRIRNTPNFCALLERSLHERRILAGRFRSIEPLESRVLLSGLTLGTPISLTTAENPGNVTAADFNGDGAMDFAVVNRAGSVGIFLNRGDGTFLPRVDYATAAGPSGIATGDFNHDGKVDFAVSIEGLNYSSNTISVFLNLGNGAFGPRQDFTSALGPHSLVASDFNGDGWTDLASGNFSTHDLTVYLNDKDGTFTAASMNTYQMPKITSMFAGDFDADGKMDLAYTVDLSSGIDVVVVPFNTGGGVLQSGTKSMIGQGPCAIASADFDGNGFPDIAVALSGQSGINVLMNSGSRLMTFSATSSLSAEAPTTAIATADLNGDGKPDILALNSGAVGSNLNVWLNLGGGAFSRFSYSAGNNPTAVAIADFNGDGTPDIAITHASDNALTILPNFTPTGSASIFSHSALTLNAGDTLSVGVKVLDANGNLATASNAAITISIHSGPAGAALGGVLTVQPVNGIATFALALHKAGNYSLQASGTSLSPDSLSGIVVQPSNPAALAFTAEPTTIYDGESATSPVQVSLLDAFANPLTAGSSTVTLRISGGTPGADYGTLTATTVNGIATFSPLPALPAGVYSLQATDGTLAAAIDSNFTVVYRPPAQLAIAQQPLGVYATQNFGTPIIVDVENLWGKVLPNFNGPVTLSIANGPGGGLLGGPVTVQAQNGVAAFTGLSVSRWGNYTLRAAAAGFTVNLQGIWASPTTSQLAIVQQPADITAGSVDPVAVDFAFCGLPMTAGTTPVTVAIAAGPAGAQIIGTTTVNAQDGIASFSDLAFTCAGTYTLTLTASAPWLSTLTQSFTVSPAAPAQLVFTAFPVAYDGETPASPIGVAVKDAFGNVATTDASTVTLAISGGPDSRAWGPLTATAVNGVALFPDFPPLAAGTYSLQATDGDLAAAASPYSVVKRPASQIALGQQPSAVCAGKPFGLTVSILDLFGRPVTDYHVPVTLFLSTGPSGGTLAGTLTVQPVDGIATFNAVTVSKTGTYYLWVKTGSLLLFLPTLAAVDPPTHIGISPLPAQIGAGQNLPLTVTLLNILNQVVTASSATVAVSILSGPSGASLAGSAALTTTAGVAAFSDLSFSTLGTYLLDINAPGAGDVTTSAISVTPDRASSQLVVTRTPVALVVGAALPLLQLAVRDRLGNAIATDRSTVKLTIAAGPGGAMLGTATATASAGVVSFKNLSFTRAGTYTLLATDTTLATPTLSIPLVVSPGVTSSGTTSLPSGLLFGQTITLTTALKSSAAKSIPFTGSLQLLDADSRVLGTATLTAAGTAKFALTGLAAGGYACTLQYPGDVNHTSASSPILPLTIKKAASPLTLKSSASQPVFGQSVTLTATLPAALIATRTGSLQFLDAGITLATIPVTSATTTFTPPTLSVGTHAFTVSYSGDNNFLASNSSLLKLTVKKAATKALLQSPAAPVVANQPFELLATVVAALPNGSTIVDTLPGGTVTLKEGNTVLKTLPTGGYTSTAPIYVTPALITLSLAPGTHKLTALFSGDANYNPSTSPVLTLIVTHPASAGLVNS